MYNVIGFSQQQRCNRGGNQRNKCFYKKKDGGSKREREREKNKLNFWSFAVLRLNGVQQLSMVDMESREDYTHLFLADLAQSPKHISRQHARFYLLKIY